MADLEIQYDPITVNSGPVTVAVTGLDNIKVDSKLAVTQPIETKSALTLLTPDTLKSDAKADAKLTLSIPDPIKTESKASLDLQPVVVDQCLRLSLGPLPPTLVCLPNRQRLGLTVFGVEVFGLTLDGEARVLVQDLPKPAHVINVTTPIHRAPQIEPLPHIPDDPHHVQAHGAGPDSAPAAPQRSPPFVVRLGG